MASLQYLKSKAHVQGEAHCMVRNSINEREILQGGLNRGKHNTDMITALVKPFSSKGFRAF